MARAAQGEDHGCRSRLGDAQLRVRSTRHGSAGARLCIRPAARTSEPEDLAREVIDFDSESPHGLQFLAFSTATGLSPYTFRTAPKNLSASVVTTDFFGFDTSDEHYHLQGLGSVSEMGDAVLGLVSKEMGAAAPRWVALRNVSDPQIKADGLTLKEQAAIAANIYKGFGRWSSVCSAIVCWALIAAE